MVSSLWGAYMMLIGLAAIASSLADFWGTIAMLCWEIKLLGGSTYEMVILLDSQALIFIGVVLFVAGMVFVYSTYYMEGDLFSLRFSWVLALFVLSMLLLVLSPNMVSMLLGWDGLGLVSFCLVIYYQSPKSYGAGMLTVLSNRVGDVAILLAIGLMIDQGGWALVPTTLISGSSYGVLLLLAAMTSSAQMPFSAWLPAAMAAPTPVSALVHSSTLVTAGVYVLIRGGWVMGQGEKMILLFVAVTTMFMAGLGALYENDLSKIIALSTLSQLGLMMALLSAGGYQVALFHLLTHALFKSLLFLCAGYAIHQLGGSQDLRVAGAMGVYSPVVSAWMGAANYALCGVPFLAGFYSKDLLLEYLMSSGANSLAVILLVLACGLTVAYTVRLASYTGVGGASGGGCAGFGEAGPVVLWPLGGLGTGATVAGAALMWAVAGTHTLCLGDMEKCAVLLMGGAGLLVGVTGWLAEINYSRALSYAGGMWFLPVLSVAGLSGVYQLSWAVERGNETGWNEVWGGGGGWEKAQLGSQGLAFYQHSDIKVYLTGAFLWVVLFTL